MPFDFNAFIKDELNKAIYDSLGPEDVTFTVYDEEDEEDVDVTISCVVNRIDSNRDAVEQGDDDLYMLTLYVGADVAEASALGRLPEMGDRFSYDGKDYKVNSVMKDQGGAEIMGISNTEVDYLTNQIERRPPRG
jgi:hypothetical protein